MRILALALALALGACTSPTFIGVGGVPKEQTAEALCTGMPLLFGAAIAVTCPGGVLLGGGYAATTLPVVCEPKPAVWGVGVFLAECRSVGPASAAQPK